MTAMTLKNDYACLKDALVKQLEIRLDALRNVRYHQSVVDDSSDQIARIREQMQEIERQLRPRAA